MRSTSHPQDDLLIVEALYGHGHEIEDSDPDRANRAWELAANIADEHGLDMSDALFQIDYTENSEYGCYTTPKYP